MNVIYPYCKGALFDIINVITWLHIQLIDSCYMIAKNLPKTPTKTCQKPAKNPMRTKICSDHAKIFCENFNIKILNNNKNSLILPNKTKTHEST
jgi:hypothetical protein